MLSFLFVFSHVYVLASLFQPTDTLNITLHFTRQLQDELALHKSKIAAATREADHEHLCGNTLVGSFRFIRNDVWATIQTAIHAAALVVRVFILLSILLITTLVDGFKFYRHLLMEGSSSSSSSTFHARGKKKIIKYLPSQHPVNKSLLSLVLFATTFTNSGTDDDDDETTNTLMENSSGSGIESHTDLLPPASSDDLPWFKTLFPTISNTSTTNSKNGHPSSTLLDVESEMDKKNEWNGSSAKESSTRAPNIHTTTTTTLFISDHHDEENDNSDRISMDENISSSLSLSSLSSKDSLSTIGTSKRSLFSLRRTGRKGQPSAVPKDALSPPRPLATYSSRPFTTSNALITASQIAQPLGSSFSLKLKQPGRRLSLLFKTKKTKK